MPTDRLNAAGSAGRAPDDEARRSSDADDAHLAAGRQSGRPGVNA